MRGNARVVSGLTGTLDKKLLLRSAADDSDDGDGDV